MSAEEPMEESETTESVTLPASMVSGMKPGDTVSLTIETINEDGTATASAAESESPEEMPEGSDALASQVTNPPEE